MEDWLAPVGDAMGSRRRSPETYYRGQGASIRVKSDFGPITNVDNSRFLGAVEVAAVVHVNHGRIQPQRAACHQQHGPDHDPRRFFTRT